MRKLITFQREKISGETFNYRHWTVKFGPIGPQNYCSWLTWGTDSEISYTPPESLLINGSVPETSPPTCIKSTKLKSIWTKICDRKSLKRANTPTPAAALKDSGQDS